MLSGADSALNRPLGDFFSIIFCVTRNLKINAQTGYLKDLSKNVNPYAKKHPILYLIEPAELLLLQRWHNLSNYILLVQEIIDA
jgi:hypothetical protein